MIPYLETNTASLISIPSTPPATILPPFYKTMAHNSHVPWTLLSNNLKYTPTSTSHHGQTNLYPRFLPSQSAKINHFVSVFSKTITSFSATERAKYPSPTKIPELDETIISDETVKKIEKTVENYRATNPSLVGRPGCSCPKSNSGCYCRISTRDRTPRKFIEELQCTSLPTHASCCCYTNSHTDALELLKTLLLHGQLSSLLSITSHPAIHLSENIWNIPWECSGEWGLGALARCILTSYIFLNITYLHPETWDPVYRQKFIAGKAKTGTVYKKEEVDYRKSTAWRKVISRCTGKGYKEFEVHKYPHRVFYGMSGEEYNSVYWNSRTQNFGQRFSEPEVPGVAKKVREERYLPLSEDISTVLILLRRRGLPTELGLKILDFADYRAERRCPISEDPLHPENRSELKKYLSWCWKILVWSDLLFKEDKREIQWEYEIAEVVKVLWGSGEDSGGRKMFRYLSMDEETDIDIVLREEGRDVMSVPGRRVVFGKGKMEEIRWVTKEGYYYKPIDS